MRLLTSIQTLRAVAAIGVVLVHAGYDAAGYSGVRWLETAGDLGRVGVDIFFVISGFIMYLTACRTTMSPQSFVAERISRIAPLYWLMTFALLALALAGRSIAWPSARQLVLSLSFLPYLNDKGDVAPFLYVGWTLTFEMFFYALLALSLILRPLHVGILTGVLGLLVAAGAAFPGGPLAWTVYTDPILLEFAAGLWIGWAWNKGFRLPAPAGAVLLALCVLAIGMSYGHPVWEGRWLRPLAWGLPALGIVLGVLALEGTGPMASRIGLLLGAASYAIYLVHPLVLVVLGRAWLVGQVTSPVVIVGVSLLASIAAGVVCHLALERPLVRASRTLLGLGGRTRPAELLPRAR
jgi:exopolysaccharide production protein ExoZ